MKTLLIAVIIFAVQPAKAPPHEKATEANRAESTRNTKSAQQDQTQHAQPTPAALQASIVPEGQKSATTGDDHTGNKQASDENLSIQRKLTWFTGVLAAVGVLQLVVMFLTWLVYRRQAREMRRQRHEMRQQRHVMFRQWNAMREQAGLMEQQTGILVEYNKATREAADAAAKSAAATEQSVKAQQTAMSQWVTFQGWKHKVRKNTGGDWVFELNFDIVNPTDWKMNLISTILRVRDRELMTNHFVPLLPKEPYTLGMSAIVMGKGGGGYFEGGMTGFILFGAIVYVDCFGVPQNQVFSGYVSCIEGGETNFRMEYFPDNPYVQKKPEEAN